MQTEFDNDFAGIRNWFNEFYARDTSHKIRAVNKAKGERGDRLTVNIPYGYMKDPDAPKAWIVDDEATLVVKKFSHSVWRARGRVKSPHCLKRKRYLIPPPTNSVRIEKHSILKSSSAQDTSDDGKHFIMGNGTRAFAVVAEQPTEKENPLKHVEDTIEQNDNNFDGIINNTQTVDELEAKVKAGESISIVDLANAIKAEEKGGKGKPKEEKQSIRAQLKKDAGKEKAAPKKAATKKKNNDLEV